MIRVTVENEFHLYSCDIVLEFGSYEGGKKKNRTNDRRMIRDHFIPLISWASVTLIYEEISKGDNSYNYECSHNF